MQLSSGANLRTSDSEVEQVSFKGSGYDGEGYSSSKENVGNTENFSAKVVAHLPDEVVTTDQNKGVPYQVSHQGVLMFLDISGFTALTEKYSMNAKNGTDQLTKTLNSYMNSLVSEIISHDGDVLEFAGDAILSVWHVENFVGMKITVNHVIKCAMNVQRKCGKFNTSVGVTLRVKIGISAGEVLTTYLGTQDFCHYVTSGRAVESVNAAEHFCESGDIILSPSAWVHCAGLPINVEIQADNKHRKILDDPEDEEDKERFLKLTSSSQYAASRIVAVDSSAYDTLKGRQRSVYDPASAGLEQTFVRKTVLRGYSDDQLEHMQLYLSPPVKKKLRTGQPLEYLNEMRQVTIVFMNLDLNQSTRYEMSQTLQAAFSVILADLKEVEGLLNKLFMFDKGCTFLAIFGLPGFKHENDCARALQCAYKIQQDLKDVKQINQVSVGVTTGSTYCGVMGHEFRHEYTVIGRKVNMAARLMMYYPSKVTCDNETFHHSKIPKPNFQLLEVKPMKGLKNIGTIREYKETKGHVDTQDILKQQEEEFPIIGRNIELNILTDQLKLLGANKGDKIPKMHILAIKGDIGSGKSRLLDAMIVKCVKAQIKVVFSHIERTDNQPFLAAKVLLLELLSFDVTRPHHEREAFMYMNFRNPLISSNMGLLNNLLYMKIKWDDHLRRMKLDEVTKTTFLVIKAIITEMTNKLGGLVFAIDDAHNMDSESWQLIDALGVNEKSLVLLTMKSPLRHNQGGHISILEKPTSMIINLAGIDSDYLTPLACQFLGVIAMPKELETLLLQKSHGVPSWVEQLVFSMLYDGLLALVPDGSFNPPYEMVMGGDAVVKSGASIKGRDTKFLKEKSVYAFEEEDHAKSLKDKKICIIPKGKSLSDMRVPDSIRGMIQAQIDRMEESDQMIVKTAAVLGKVFSRELLQHVMTKKMFSSELNAHLLSIAEHGIFECGSPLLPRGSLTSFISNNKDNNYICFCRQAGEYSDNGGIWTCRLFSFKSATVQETAYEMFTESLRRKIHIRAGKFLESQAHRCDFCGGQNFNGVEGRPSEKPRESLGDSALTEFIQRRGSTSSEDEEEVTGAVNVHLLMNKQTHTSMRGLKQIRRSSFQRYSILQHEAHRGSIMAGMEDDDEDENDAFGQATRRASIGNDLKVDSVRKAPSSTLRKSMAIHAPKTTFQGNKDNSVRAFNEEKATDVLSPQNVAQRKQSLDMRECHCLDILLSVYPQLVRHWKAAGNMQRTVMFLMEAATAAIAVDDNSQAVSYLREVQHIKESCNKGENPFEGEVSFVEVFVFDVWDEVRLESLLGQALYHMGQIEQSLPHFYTALSTLGVQQPSSKLGVLLSIMSEGFRQWKHHHWPRDYIGTAGPLMGPRMIEQAKCLSHVFHDYLEHPNSHLKALLSVLQQLNKAEEVGTDTQELIIAYTCMMECCQNRYWTELGKAYEEKAREVAALETDKTVEIFMAVVHLFATSMSMRLSWGEFEAAIKAGYQANTIASKLHDSDMRIQILPILSQALMFSNRITDAVDVLKELEYTDNECEAVVGKTLYCICCLDLLLEYGIQLERYVKCSKFAQLIRKNEVFRGDPVPVYHITCSLRLWCQRRLINDEAENWQQVAKSWLPKGTKGSSVMAAKAYLKDLEADLISLSINLQQRNAHKVNELKQTVNASLKSLRGIIAKLPIWKPRLLHYEAYFCAIRDNTRAARRLLSKSIKLSDRMRNELDMAWAEHSKKVWFDPAFERSQNQFWTVKTHTARALDWHALKLSETKLITYSLPLPHWF